MNALLEQREGILKRLEAVNAADEFDQDAYDAAKRELDEVDGKIKRARELDEARAATPKMPEESRKVLEAATAPTPTEPAEGDGEARSAQPRIESAPRDPGHYRGAQGEHSWFHDRYISHTRGDQAAQRRLEESNQHGMQWRKDHADKPEWRDLTMATDTDGGALTPVLYLQDMHAELLRSMSPTLGIMQRLPLPYGTDQISIPLVSTGSAVAVQSTENNALQETDIVWGTNVTANVWYTAGLQDISLQLFEQSNPAVEQIVMRDLMGAAVVDLGTDILAGSGTNEAEGILNADGIGTTTYTAGTATFQGLYSAMVASANDVHTSIYQTISHWIVAPRRAAWMLAQVDGSNRPQLGFSPQNTVGAVGGLAAEGAVFSILGKPVIADPNMPTNLGSGTDEDRVVALKADECLLFMREPKVEIDFSVGFRTNTIAVRVNLPHAFTAERRPGAISVVSGTGLNDTL